MKIRILLIGISTAALLFILNVQDARAQRVYEQSYVLRNNPVNSGFTYAFDMKFVIIAEYNKLTISFGAPDRLDQKSTQFKYKGKVYTDADMQRGIIDVEANVYISLYVNGKKVVGSLKIKESTHANIPYSQIGTDFDVAKARVAQYRIEVERSEDITPESRYPYVNESTASPQTSSTGSSASASGTTSAGSVKEGNEKPKDLEQKNSDNVKEGNKKEQNNSGNSPRTSSYNYDRQQLIKEQQQLAQQQLTQASAQAAVAIVQLAEMISNEVEKAKIRRNTFAGKTFIEAANEYVADSSTDDTRKKLEMVVKKYQSTDYSKDAAFLLGIMYAEADCVHTDYAKSYAYFDNAALNFKKHYLKPKTQEAINMRDSLPLTKKTKLKGKYISGGLRHYFFIGYSGDMHSLIGITLGSLKNRVPGIYGSIRFSPCLFVPSETDYNFIINSGYDVSDYKLSTINFSFGLTQKVYYPCWLYAGINFGYTNLKSMYKKVTDKGIDKVYYRPLEGRYDVGIDAGVIAQWKIFYISLGFRTNFTKQIDKEGNMRGGLPAYSSNAAKQRPVSYAARHISDKALFTFGAGFAF
jgi:hypothetical protein